MTSSRRVNPVYRSMSRHLTILGAERKLFFFAMCIGAGSGPLWKDCETFDEARDWADRNEELYLCVYVYDDAGALLYETGKGLNG